MSQKFACAIACEDDASYQTKEKKKKEKNTCNILIYTPFLQQIPLLSFFSLFCTYIYFFKHLIQWGGELGFRSIQPYVIVNSYIYNIYFLYFNYVPQELLPHMWSSLINFTYLNHSYKDYIIRVEIISYKRYIATRLL